jgi:DNA-binding winged helix-turn-helix (wHTH) protein
LAVNGLDQLYARGGEAMQPFLVTPATATGSRFPDRRTVAGCEASAAEAAERIEFGRFSVLPRQRRLLADGVPVEIGARAFAVLLALIEAGGAAVAKRALLARAWPDVVVEESNLRVQVCALRKALGTDRDYVRTEPGHGYRLTATVRPTAAIVGVSSAAKAIASPGPAEIGRPGDPLAIARQLARIEAKLTEALRLLSATSAKAG